MKLWTIFRFEFSYLAGRIVTWLYLAVLFLFTLVMNQLTSPGDGVYVNNTFHITAITVIGILIWLVMSASIAGEAAARDMKARMYSLTYTSPVSKSDYLGGRFLAAFSVNALLILSLPLGVLIFFYLPGMEEGEFGPFRAWPYLSVYLLIALPAVFLATALQFCFAALNRQVMSSYLASLLLALVAQIIAITVAKLFGNWDLVKLLDPVGIAGIVGNELQTWTAADKNTRLITLEGMFLWNRLLWISLAAGTLIFTYKRFSFAYPETNIRWKLFRNKPTIQSKLNSEKSVPEARAISVPHVSRNFGFATWFYQTCMIAGASFKKIARNPVGLTLVAAIVTLSVIFASRIMIQYGIPVIPTTQQVIGYLCSAVVNVSSPWVVIPLLIMYFMGELVWAERDGGLNDLTDATPVPEWVLLIGKFLGMALIIIIWMALLMAGGILMQLSLGYDKLDIGLYLQALFGLQFADYLIFTLLALIVHVLVNQKSIAHIVILLAFSFMAFPSIFQVEHSMLIFGKDPGWRYTDMRGFGSTIGPWLWFKAYWFAWSMLLAVAARLLWASGRERSFKYRIQLIRQRFSGSTRWVTILGLILVITLGSFILYNTNVLNEYLTSFDLNERKAQYEKLYGRYRNRPQPQLTATKLLVEIYPESKKVGIRASYTLVNNTGVQIDSIHFGSVSGIAPAEINFNRSATAVLTDQKLSYYIYTLKQALMPGDSLKLNFVVNYEQTGFRHSGTKELLVKNGTHFNNYDLLPSVGYQPYRELNDAVIRKKYKLRARPEIQSLYDSKAQKKPLSTDQVIFEAIIGTSKDEIAVAPGTLQKSWTKGSRRYFQYKTNAPIGGEYTILSGNYAVKESSWNDVAIRIYYHPGHDENIDRMIRSVKASLSYYSEEFGPYPFKYFTVIERAGTDAGASADAGMIYYGETYSLLRPDDSQKGFDLPYYILAHEVAHQWWGLASLSPANVEGAGVLIEGLSVYSGMQVLEKEYGMGHLQQYVNYLHSSYEMPRTLATASLIRANESFLYYRKGGLAMYALSKYIGKEKVNNALRILLQKHQSGELPLPTTLDLFQEIKQVTPDSLNYLLQDLFMKNTYWRLKTKQIAAKQIKAGNWQVTLKVHAQKVVVDSTGAEFDMPMNDLLEIGLYVENKGLNDPLYLQMHRIRSGEQTIKVNVPRQPDRGGIDPNSLMIDIRTDDNMMELGGR
ncbi:ABC transporter permease/M1 family aminopeptidase [Daejeonella oryzae]|uniref:ABC transporter permease/M1 family aminopeptidase n=1 Tax=Daejeonella oryzae TaxID=1122943 RepID=UPI00047907CD|nr:ABC transporter permease [Daejeonella oryzae]